MGTSNAFEVLILPILQCTACIFAVFAIIQLIRVVFGLLDATESLAEPKRLGKRSPHPTNYHLVPTRSDRSTA
jgi:hypothetical protein